VAIPTPTILAVRVVQVATAAATAAAAAKSNRGYRTASHIAGAG
jgi:hypothetical protein